MYEKMIRVVPPCDNEQLKRLCVERGINIKTLGRTADTVYVPTVEEMTTLIQ